MNNPEISIIIPTFNRRSTISDSIESVLNQNLNNWELIIIDDGSIDRTEELIKPYLKNKKIKYFYQENMGVSAARNAGANLAKGDYLIFLDSDDTFFPELISTLYHNKFYEFDIISWEVVRIIDGNVKIKKPNRLNRMFNNVKANFLAGSVCFKKSVFNRAGGYDSKMNFSENYELGMRVSHLDNLTVKIINVPLVKYEINTNLRISNSLENRLTSHIYQFKKHRELYNLNKKAKAELKYLIGFVLENSKRKKAALKQYKSAWLSYPLNIKAFIKIILLRYF